MRNKNATKEEIEFASMDLLNAKIKYNDLIEHRICPNCDGLGFLKKLNLIIMECSYCGEEFVITPEQLRRICQNV